jgi:alanine racemase
VKSWVEISAAKLRANYTAIRRAAGDDVEAMAVIKANAYGHDAVLCGRVLLAAGARWLGVADIEEAGRLRADTAFDNARILLMSAIEAADAPSIVAQNLTPVVWTSSQLNALEDAARTAGKRLPVHLEVDTGMARQGAAGEELSAALAHLAHSPWLELEGLMTHLACAEVVQSANTAVQRQRFQDALDLALAAGLRPRYLHLANSSALDEGSALRWLGDLASTAAIPVMVRAGISLYGYTLPLVNPRDEQGEALAAQGSLAGQLQPILTWKTRILALRDVSPGGTVGYGASFTASHAMRVALLPIGYSDGFRRSASSGAPPDWQRGWVMVRGQRAHVVGCVSMNLTVIDVTTIEDVQEGDVVTLLGERVTADDHAAWAGTISYEILCGIRARHGLA